MKNISAAFGGILSKMAGGSRHTGAYISRMGTKWNELDEEMAAMRGESSKMGNDLDGVNGFYLYYEDNIPDDVKNILLIQQLS